MLEGKDKSVQGNEKKRDMEDAIPPELWEIEEEIEGEIVQSDNRPHKTCDTESYQIHFRIGEKKHRKVQRGHHAERKTSSVGKKVFHVEVRAERNRVDGIKESKGRHTYEETFLPVDPPESEHVLSDENLHKERECHKGNHHHVVCEYGQAPVF